jgi:hypothetical protein
MGQIAQRADKLHIRLCFRSAEVNSSKSRMQVNDDVINKNMLTIQELLSSIKKVLIRMNIEFELNINNLLFQIHMVEFVIAKFLLKCSIQKYNQKKIPMTIAEQHRQEHEQSLIEVHHDFLEAVFLIQIQQQIGVKELSQIFQRGEVYIEKQRFIEKLLQYLSVVINSIDNFPV